MSTTAKYRVNGMTCGHCVHAVVTELNAVEGVTDVYVALVPGAISTVTVESGTPLAAEDVSVAIEAAGYSLVVPG